MNIRIFLIYLYRFKTKTLKSQPIPLCKDGFLRPYLLSIIIDVTSRSSQKVKLSFVIIKNFA